MHPVPSPMTLAFDVYGKSRHFQRPRPPILVGKPISGLNCSSLSLQPVDLVDSLVGADQGFSPANRGFYFRAFDGLITRTVAGYGYSGNWASSTGGIYTH
jgi:hypothetical protein